MELVEFRDMIYAVAVYEEKSFSRAAERCFVSQPSLSKSVKRLENNLGFPLFDRSASPVTATLDGKNVIAYFQRMMDLQKKLEFYCQGVRCRTRSDLTIGAPSFFCTCLLPPVVAAFQLDHPGCRIKIVECNDSELQKFLRLGVADMGFSVETGMPSDFQAVELKKERIILAVPGGWPVNRGLEDYALTREELASGHIPPKKARGLPMSTFAHERFLMLKEGNDMYRRSMDICQDSGFSPLVVMELDQLLTAYYLAAAGEGIAFIRSSIPHYVDDQDKLCYYRIDHPATQRTIRVFYPSGMTLTASQQTFLDYLKQYPFPG